MKLSEVKNILPNLEINTSLEESQDSKETKDA